MAKQFAAQMQQLARAEASPRAYTLPSSTCVPEFSTFPRLSDFCDLDEDAMDQFDRRPDAAGAWSDIPPSVNVDKIIEFSQRTHSSQLLRSQRSFTAATQVSARVYTLAFPREP
jgi:hypothetical protein